MRNVLIIETTTNTASLALVIDGELVSEKSFVSDRRHNAMLFEPMEELFIDHGRPQLDGVLVGSGPGSYSGTRVGIAAAQGVALVSGCKAIAVPSILGTPAALSGQKCWAAGDARRGSYWIATIDEYVISSGPSLMDSEGFTQALIEADAAGIGIFCLDAIRGITIPVLTPTSSGLWQAWHHASDSVRDAWAFQIPQPIYLAPPHITESKKKVFG